MKKFAIAACAMLMAGSANAAIFAGNITFSSQTNNNGLTVSSGTNPTSFTTNNLNVGQSQLLNNVITLNSTYPVGWSCALGCSATDSINLAFNFTSPSSASFNQGGAVSETVFTFSGFLNNGVVSWANADNWDLNGFYARNLVTFANGASAYVDIYNTAMSTSGSNMSAGIDVRIRNLANPTPAVPEPATWAMMIAGLGLVGASMRRRSAQVTFA
ncbi:PEPxxWA-CTERM sorting domain-containing protein [Sphingobium sp. B11D3D]|uniref:PEPxxWA-CTERM sorting domain-containing protein n=1 Tax=Sphingobium sp. B11D3D TaxID=2940576 RepID=UPI002223EE75|nr:PEPxxWA-CTERM sorting domain-containing protein [Sphingobium sp. B11D3D]MCW2370058.1 hypothetical protein [Sphingobium sp. B11D3D]